MPYDPQLASTKNDDTSANPLLELVSSPAVLEHRDDCLAGLPLLIPIPKVAKLLGISRSAAYRCAACGDLPTAHLGGRVYVVTSKLQLLLESA